RRAAWTGRAGDGFPIRERRRGSGGGARAPGERGRARTGPVRRPAGLPRQVVLPGQPARDLPPVRAADNPARPPRLQVGGAGDLPPGRRGPPEAGGLRAVRRSWAGRRAGAPQVRAPDRRVTERNQSFGAIVSLVRGEWYGLHWVM